MAENLYDTRGLAHADRDAHLRKNALRSPTLSRVSPITSRRALTSSQTSARSGSARTPNRSSTIATYTIRVVRPTTVSTGRCAGVTVNRERPSHREHSHKAAVLRPVTS